MDAANRDARGDFFEAWGPSGSSLFLLVGDRATIGRSLSNDVALVADPEVSRLHAVVERFPAGWAVRDMGSSNGTFVNGEKIAGERVLHSRDELRVGATRLIYRPSSEEALGRGTLTGDAPPRLTPRERDVLVALCRPLLGSEPFTRPATAAEIAHELVVSEAGVKFHLANLYTKFGLQESGGSRRQVLANEAMRRRAVNVTELRHPAQAARSQPERTDRDSTGA